MDYRGAKDINDVLKESENISSIPVQQPIQFNIPPPPKKSQYVPVAKKQADQKKHDEDRVKKVRIRVMINEYIESKRFGAFLEERGFQKIDANRAEKMCLEELQAYLTEVKAAMSSQCKKDLVNGMAQGVMQGLGTFLFMTMGDPKYLQVSEKFAQDPEFFQPELEEIAIEMDPSYIPGPEKRLAVKVASLIAEVYQQTDAFKKQMSPEKENISKKD